MFKSQMSDVPAGAFWALASYWTLDTSFSSALAAGVASSIATLIRPNVVPVAAVLGLRIAWSTGVRRLVAFAAGALPGCLIVAGINNSLYGSPPLSS